MSEIKFLLATSNGQALQVAETGSKLIDENITLLKLEASSQQSPQEKRFPE